MKKSIIISILFFGLIFSSSFVFADETKNLDNILQEEQYNVVSENGSVQIVKQGEKYALYNKDTSSFIIKPVLDEVYLFNEDKPYLYKIKIGENLGFIDLNSGTKIITVFDDLSLVDNFIKFKKENKYGLMNLKSDVIIPAEYDKINITLLDNEKVITTKSGNKYKMFTLDGKELKESDLYKVDTSSDKYIDLIKDLKPKIKEYLIAKKADETIVIGDEVNPNVKVAAIEKNVEQTEPEIKAPVEELPKTKEVTYGNYNFIVLEKDNKIGLSDSKGYEIAPMIFDKIDIDTPCSHFKDPIAIAKNAEQISIYNINGKKLGFFKDNTGYVFMNGNTYKYTRYSDKIWEVKLDKKLVGRLIQDNSEDKYRYVKTAFSFKNMHKANEIFINLLSM